MFLTDNLKYITVPNKYNKLVGTENTVPIPTFKFRKLISKQIKLKMYIFELKDLTVFQARLVGGTQSKLAKKHPENNNRNRNNNTLVFGLLCYLFRLQDV